jgi:hypothetical protein
MPPEIPVLPPPPAGEYGHAAKEWLDHHGITSQVPAIRARDNSTAREDPFLYYLQSRLGIYPLFQAPTQACSRGNWVHSYLYNIRQDEATREDAFRRAVDDHIVEIRERCKSIGWDSDKLLNTIDEERLNARCARGWLMALSALTFPFMPKGLFAWLRSPGMTPICAETTLAIDHPNYPKTKLAATFDLLYYTPNNNKIWVLDYKTSTPSPLVRGSTCRISFQSLHYRYILQSILESGWLHEQHPHLPRDLTFGGIVHVILQKPPLSFGQKDRPYYYRSVGGRAIPMATNPAVKHFGSGTVTPNGVLWTCTLQSRSDKTQEIPTEPHHTKSFNDEHLAVKYLHEWTGKTPDCEYSGEPNPAYFAKRCLDWYRGVGSYADDHDERTQDPPINLSQVTGPLDNHELLWYDKHLNYIYSLATAEPLPCNFPPTDRGMTSRGGKLTNYAPFYATPVAEWPSLIRQAHMGIFHRDADFTGDIE